MYSSSYLIVLDRKEIFDFLTKISNSTGIILDKIENKIKQPIREVVAMMSELLRLVTPRCGSEMRKLYNEYIDEHNRMQNTLEDTKKFVYTYGKYYGFIILGFSIDLEKLF